MSATSKLKESLTVASSAGKVLAPPLKWAGGKRWIVPHLGRIWRSHHQRTYVEPFCGGLAGALGLQPERAVLNDINQHLINFYQHVQQGLSLTLEMRYEETLFYQYRRRFNQLIHEGKHSTTEAAQLFYYLNRTCFNGLCRFNQRGEFNVPFGAYKSVRYMRDLESLQQLFKKWKFTNFDLCQLELSKSDFIYADPPYDVEFRSYSSGGFTWADQVRTAEWLAAHTGPVVLSNQATPRVIQLYRKLGFRLFYLAGPRRISCTGDRQSAREVLAVKSV